MTAKEELRNLELELDFSQLTVCTEQEKRECRALIEAGKTLPPDFFHTESGLCKIAKASLTTDEKQQLIQYRQTVYLRSIKSSLKYFVILSSVGLIGGAIIAINILAR